MKEKFFYGVWRSYKVFCFSGKIEQHNLRYFREISIDDNNTLTVKDNPANRNIITLKEGEWQIIEIKKRYFLYFGKKQAFELITLEPANLVLEDRVKGEKIFFAKMPEWNNQIVPSTPTHKVVETDVFLKKH